MPALFLALSVIRELSVEQSVVDTDCLELNELLASGLQVQGPMF